MNDAVDFSTLKWVKAELDETLKKARQALEAFVGNSDDKSPLDELAAHLHQVYGTLQIVELHGAALLAEEMELVSSALSEDKIPQLEDAFEVLMRAILQLPDYLDRLVAGHRDIPIVLLPLLNDLRALRGENLMSESTMFAPDLGVPLPDHVAGNNIEGDIGDSARELRHKFQLNLLSFLRDQDTGESLASLQEIIETLCAMSRREDIRRYWWIGTGIMQSLQDGSLQTAVALKVQLGRMDQLLRRLADEGEAALPESEITEMSKNLLFYVGLSRSDNPVTADIRSTYNLDALIPGQDEIEAAQESLAGQNTELFKTVAAVVKEELKNLRSALDEMVRGDSGDMDAVQELAGGMRSMSDTLGMLGLGVQRKAILGKAENLQTCIEQQQAPSETALMEVASTLLLIDSAMGQMEQGHAVIVPESDDDVDASLAESEFDQVKAVVLNEAISDLVRAKESIVEFMDEGDARLVGDATQLLGQVKGGLLLLDETRAASLIDTAAKYIDQKITKADDLPSEKELESLADSVCGVEYYLEGLRESRLFGDNAIDVAEQSIADLGYLPDQQEDDSQSVVDAADSEESVTDANEALADETPVEEEPAMTEPDPDDAVVMAVVETEDHQEISENDVTDLTAAETPYVDVSGTANYDEEMAEFPVMGDETDEEILEIFIEEAEEEIESFAEQLPIWANDPTQTEALETFRRSFHTLKGSGRLVGAMRIGEFAWAFESMLNRVLDNSIEPSPEMIDILYQSLDALPSLVAQIQHGTPLDKPVAWLMSAANALSAGEAIPVLETATADDQAAAESVATETDEQSSEADTATEAETAEMDPVLYEIYQAEVNNHFAVIDSFLESGSDRVNDELVRALHTLHGSAGTASVNSIADVSARLERYTKLLLDADRALDDAGVAALQEGRSVMGGLFGQLPGAISEDENLAELLQRLDDLCAKTSEEIEAAEQLAAAEAMSQPAETVDTDSIQPANDESVEDDPYADYDQELLQIFLEESSDSLERSEAALVDWRADTGNQQALEQLQRELHTLKGGARMTGLGEVGDLAHALESVIIQMVETGASRTDGLDLIQRAHDQLVSDVDRISKRQPMQDGSDLIAHLDSLLAGESVTTEAQAEDVVPDYGDPELVEIFIEEASDILESSEETLQLWKSDTDNVEHIAALKRELHTLKGGARMADISDIGDLAHGVESLLVMLSDGEIQSSPQTFTVLERAHDHLVGMVASLQNRRVMDPAQDLLQQLEALRNGESVEVAEETVREIPQQPTRDKQQTVESRVQVRDGNELVRVKASLLDELVNHAGEVSIYRSRLEQQVGASRFNLVEMEQTVLRLREQLRKLEIETEAQILFRYEKELDETSTDFDPLEMDRYSNLQQLSRSLMESVADLTSIQNMLENISRESETLLLQQSRVNTELQEGLMRTRMVPFLGLAPRMRRIIRQTSEELGKKVELELSGAEGELDRTVIDRIIAPIEHMLRNSVSHGIESPEIRKELGKPETGTISISFDREASDIVLRLTDDGAGINLESVRTKAIERGLMDADATLSDNDILQFILETGFSTAQNVTQVSGRGVGMDVVSSEVKQLGGTLHIASEQGKGTTFTIRLPFTLAINQALLVQVGEDTFAVPLSTILGIVRIDKQDLEIYYDDPSLRFSYDGIDYEVRNLGAVLGTHNVNLDALPDRVPVLLARSGDITVALQVEDLLGSREIVVKSVGPQISTVRGVSGATILGDGRVVMILDTTALLRGGVSLMTQVEELVHQPAQVEQATIMVVDDSITVRKVTTRLLERNDMRVITAKDGVDAVSKLHETVPDVMLLDIEMPRMDGFELATHVRNDARLKHVPIIMITSRTGDKHRQRATEIGVNHYLGKPFQEAELLENIRNLLQG